MRPSPFRPALALALLLTLGCGSGNLCRLAAAVDDPAPAKAATEPAKAATEAATAAVAPAQDTAEAKLEVALRSFAVVREENDRLLAAQEKQGQENAATEARLSAQVAGLESQVAALKGAVPLAAQAAALREQLRQTQDQLAAVSLENHQLKTQLSLGAPAPGTVLAAPASPAPAPAAAAASTPAPAPRVHVVAAGETLAQISRKYYGTASRWPEILAANREVLRDEKGLVVGSSLRIP
jgi:nucleoid-associated protein YgaU